MGSIHSQSAGFDVPMDRTIGNTALGARLETMHRSGQRALEELLNTGNLGMKKTGLFHINFQKFLQLQEKFHKARNKIDPGKNWKCYKKNYKFRIITTLVREYKIGGRPSFVKLDKSNSSNPFYKRVKITARRKNKIFNAQTTRVSSSVSDPYHFDADPDPRIRIRDDGSGSWLLIRIRIWIRGNFWFCESDFPY